MGHGCSIGLTVYNSKEGVFNPVTCKIEGAPLGLYVWDGSQWQGIGTKSALLADPGEGIVGGKLIDREGNDYHIGTFGTAGTWMTENLRTTTAPGLVALVENVVGSSWNDLDYSYPNGGRPYAGKPASWTEREGILYQWNAMMNRNTCAINNQMQGTPGEQTEIIQGICPFGWHVPSDKEWNQLEQVISEDAASYASGYPLGQGGPWTETYPTSTYPRGTHNLLMKSKTPVGGADAGFSKPASSGGFDILLLGMGSSYYGQRGLLWTSSSYASLTAGSRHFYTIDLSVYRNSDMRGSQLSVRCKKD